MKKKKLKKPGPKPLLPHEVRTVVASSLDKTGSYSCPYSTVFAGTKSNTSMSPSTAVYAVTKSITGRNHKKHKKQSPGMKTPSPLGQQ